MPTTTNKKHHTSFCVNFANHYLFIGAKALDTMRYSLQYLATLARLWIGEQVPYF